MQYNPNLYVKLGQEGRENPRYLGAMAGGSMSVHNAKYRDEETDFHKDGSTGYHDHSSKGRKVTADDFMLMSAAGSVGGQRSGAPNNTISPPQSMRQQPSPLQQQHYSTAPRSGNNYQSVGYQQRNPHTQSVTSSSGYPPPPHQHQQMTSQDFASQLQSASRRGYPVQQQQQQQQQQQHRSYQHPAPAQPIQSQRPMSAQDFASQMQQSRGYKQPPQQYNSPPVQSYRVPPSESGYSEYTAPRQPTQTTNLGMQRTPADNPGMYGGTVKSRYPNSQLSRLPGETDASDAGYMVLDEYGNPIPGRNQMQPHSYAPDGTPLDMYGNPILDGGVNGAGGIGGSNGSVLGRGGVGGAGDRQGKGMSIYGKPGGRNQQTKTVGSTHARPAGGGSGVSHYRVGDYNPVAEATVPAALQEPPAPLDRPFGYANYIFYPCSTCHG